jgi:hypothetical protein
MIKKEKNVKKCLLDNRIGYTWKKPQLSKTTPVCKLPYILKVRLYENCRYVIYIV